MATLVPNITLEDFKKLDASQIRRMKCCEVFDGEYVFTCTVPRTDYIRMEAENKGQLSNSVGGESFEEVMRDVIEDTLEVRPMPKRGRPRKKNKT